MRDFKPPQYLLVGLGGSLEELRTAFFASLERERVRELQTGSVWESVETPGVQRSLRLLLTDRVCHRATTDLTLRRQGRDLYVKFDTSGRTALVHLRWLVYVTAFVGLWALLYGIYYRSTNAYGSLVSDYARKFHADPTRARIGLEEGWRVNPVTHAWVRTKPIAMVDVFLSDPKLFLINMGGPPSIIAAIVGAILLIVPRNLIFLPCRWLNWPTPEEFNAVIAGHCAWVEGVLSSVLYEAFGVHEAQKINISG